MVAWIRHALNGLNTVNLISLAVLAGTCLLAGILTFVTHVSDRSWRGLWLHLLPPGLISHRSSRADVIFWLSKRLLKPFWAFPAVLSSASIGTLIHGWLAPLVPINHQPAAEPSAWLLVLFNVNMIVVGDLCYYFYHRALHNNPILWEFHKVHHSAEQMVGTTDGRVHPLDDLLFYVWYGLCAGIPYGLWLFFIADPKVEVIMGLSAIVWAHILTFSYVKHLPYALSLGWFNKVFVSPQHHHLHHSVDPIHYNRNYSILLIVWDRIFGTVFDPKPGEQFVFGLSDNEAAEYHSVTRLYTLPFVKIAALGRQWTTQRLLGRSPNHY